MLLKNKGEKNSDMILLRTHLAQRAFEHLQDFDMRTGTILLKNGVFPLSSELREDQAVLDIVANEGHELRMSIPIGPFVVYYQNKEKKAASCLPVALLLLSQEKRARGIGLDYFLHLVEVMAGDPLVKLIQLLREERERLLSEDTGVWTVSAVTLFDAVSDNLFLNITAVRQFLALNNNAGLNEYFQKVLCPPIESLDGVDFSLPIPTSQIDRIREIINDCVSGSQSLSEAFNNYYQKLGAVPLYGSLSMGGLLEKWIEAGHSVDDAWRQIWEWAESRHSPSARFHATVAFVQWPNLVPKEGIAKFWDEVLGCVFDPKSERGQPVRREAWMLRIDLAQHYFKYVMARRPGRNEEGIACFAWWLAERVSLVFGEDPTLIGAVRSTAVKVAEQHSNLHWRSSLSELEPSSLAFATLATPSVWSLSLICALSRGLGVLNYAGLDEQKRRHIVNAAAGGIYFWFPSDINSQAPVFAFDVGAKETCLKLAEIEPDPQNAEQIREIVRGVQAVERYEDILTAMQRLMELNPDVQILTIFALRSRMYLNSIPQEKILQLLADQEWFLKVHMELDDGPLQVLFDAINTALLRAGPEWWCNVPHFYAIAAESLSSDRERQKLLFLFTLLSSIRGGTTSAIDRLLHGKKKVDFHADAELFRNQFEKIMQTAPPWIASRLRPVVVSLSYSVGA